MTATVEASYVPSAWKAEHVAKIGDAAAFALPLITADDATPALPGYDLWDSWPLQHPDGQTAVIDGAELWFMLSAPCLPDPGMRHDHARIRLLSLRDGVWHDHGNAMPDGYSPGSREWAGSAVFEADGRSVTLYFTAAGRRGEAPSFEQRIFAARSTLDGTSITWSGTPEEILVADNRWYLPAAQAQGQPGFIKGFRDPAFFRDPANGRDYILFTGSAAWSDDPFNGVVGLAVHDGEGWSLCAPLIDAVGVNNELERPHILVRDGTYYLFWSTQRRTYAPDGPNGPNGLYAMAAPSLFGPYVPVNGTGLVAANPAQEPLQCYSWWAMGDDSVASFIDHWGLSGRRFEDHPELLRSQFGGTPAPRFTLAFDDGAVTISR
jgi:levansucrase